MTDKQTDAVAQARADVLETMLHGNDTLVEYYGSAGDNAAWERDRERCKRENEAQLDALIAAVRAECAAELARLRQELAMREDSEFTRMDEGITALEKAVEHLDEGEQWKAQP